MAFRIPYLKLTEAQKVKIERDLCLKEITPSYGGNFKKNYGGKEIRFFLPDPQTRDVLLPMNYAAELFGRPIINRSRIFPKVPSFEMKGPPREYQVEVIDQSLRNFMVRGTTFLNVFCSFGKTWVAAKFSSVFSKQYGMATLVTYPQVMIKKSWIGTFRNETTAKIYVIGEEDGPPDDDVQIFLAMDTMLTNIPFEIRQRIGHFVIDEADSYCTPGRKDGLLSFEPMFITVLTATYERDDGFHRMLDLMVGTERIVRISTKPFFVFQKSTSYTVDNPKMGPRGVIFDSVVQELDQIEARNSEILQIVLDNPKEKILILTKHVDHATKLTQWLTYYFQGTGRTVSILAKNARVYQDANVIVGTISKIGRGYDEKESCINWNGIRINMLILASSTKKIEQKAGRVFRSDVPVIIDFVDDNRNIKEHWRIRRNWYESRNGLVYQVKDRLCWADVREPLMNQYLAKINPNQGHQVGTEHTLIINVTPMKMIEEDQERRDSSLVQSHASKIAQQLALAGQTKLSPGQLQMPVLSRSAPPSTHPSTQPSTQPSTRPSTSSSIVMPASSSGIVPNMDQRMTQGPVKDIVSSHAARLAQQMKTISPSKSVQPVPSNPGLGKPELTLEITPVSNASSLVAQTNGLTNPIQMTYLIRGPPLTKPKSGPVTSNVNSVESGSSSVISGSVLSSSSLTETNLEDRLAKAHLNKILQQLKKT